MVKILDKSQREIDADKRKEDLERIASEIVPFKMHITKTTMILGFFDYSTNNKMFSVHPAKNKISLENKNYFEFALKVAESYEEFTKTEWTLKKEYNE